MPADLAVQGGRPTPSGHWSARRASRAMACRARQRVSLQRRWEAAADSADSGPRDSEPGEGASDEGSCGSRSCSSADRDLVAPLLVRRPGRPAGCRFSQSVLTAARAVAEQPAASLPGLEPPLRTPRSVADILTGARAARAAKADLARDVARQAEAEGLGRTAGPSSAAGSVDACTASGGVLAGAGETGTSHLGACKVGGRREDLLPCDEGTAKAKPTPPRKKLSVAELAALKFMLYSPSAGGAAAAYVAATTGLDRRQLPILQAVAGQMLLEQDEQALIDVLKEVRKLQDEGLVEPLQFCWSRAYDETPEKFRTFTVEDGVAVGDATVAKVLAAQRSWSMLLRRTPAGRAEAGLAVSGAAAGPEGAGRAAAVRCGLAQEDDAEVAGDFIEVHGELATSLIPVSNATAGVMLAATRRVSWLPPDAQALVESLFPRRSLWSTADLHASNGRVERAMAQSQSSWQCGHIRCEIHRASTCELKAQEVCAETVSGVLNLTLAFRAPGMASRFRSLLAKHLRKPGMVERLHGTPPLAATDHREAVYALFSRHSGARSQRRVAVLRQLANGDIRQRVVQHYCNPNCCPGGLAETVRKMCKYLAGALGQ